MKCWLCSRPCSDTELCTTRLSSLLPRRSQTCIPGLCFPDTEVHPQSSFGKMILTSATTTASATVAVRSNGRIFCMTKSRLRSSMPFWRRIPTPCSLAHHRDPDLFSAEDIPRQSKPAKLAGKTNEYAPTLLPTATAKRAPYSTLLLELVAVKAGS